MTKDKNFTFVDFTKCTLDDEYYDCTFVDCDFSGVKLNSLSFEECVFVRCNCSLAKFESGLRGVKFSECKITGGDFTLLNKSSHSVVFENSQLNLVNFVGVKLRKIKFSKCNLNEAYFDEADIAGSLFDECDLTRASFFKANLEKVDFYSSFNFSINPNTTRLKKTIFSTEGIKGLVDHLDIEIKN